MNTRHVVLLTYGEPPSAAFGAQLKYSWRILLGLTRSVAPIPLPVLPIIALSRARFRRKLWSDERYTSPLEPITRAQAEGLTGALRAEAPEVDWRVHVAYEFRDPLLTDFIATLPGGEPVDIVPMYLANSAFTHELSRRTIAQWNRTRGKGRGAPVRVLPPLDEEVLAALGARHVLRQLEARGIRPGADRALVLAAHGTLLEPPRPIETGRGPTECVAAGITAALRSHFGMIQIGWLNHVYGGQWTEPAADVALRMVTEAGFRSVIYYPFGFLADNAESELEGRIALRTQPGLAATHLACMNASPDLMAALARQVAAEAGAGGREARGEPAARERRAAGAGGSD